LTRQIIHAQHDRANPDHSMTIKLPRASSNLRGNRSLP
jgi:hypothetical protein